MAHSQGTEAVQPIAAEQDSAPVPAAVPPAPAPIGRRQAIAQDAASIERTLFGPAFRLWLYGVIIASMPVLSIYGFVNGQQIEVWTNLAQAVLATTGLVTAVANINKAS